MKNKGLGKVVVVAGLALLVAAFFKYDLGRYLTLDYLKSQQGAFQAYYEANRVPTIAAYMAVYIVSVALSLPGATILTLAGGALFGFGMGLLLVSFASTIGATLAFLVSRFLLRDAVQARFKDKLAPINEGVQKDGAFYLFSLRLIPAFPFFVINLVMGLTPLSVAKFFFVSQLGMLPGTAVYVNAGTQLGQITSLKGIASPGILLSFVLLGLFPFLVKTILGYFKSRKYLARYKKPRSFDYNVVVIGAGSGGLVSAYIAAAVKAKVALIEKHKMGGDCLNTGCVPSKALIKSAKVLSYIRRHKEFGLKSASAEFEFAEVMERVQRVIKQVEPHDSVERYSGLGVECISGTAKILTPYEVEVNGRKLTTKNIIIATGGRPAAPAIKGIEKIKFFDSDTVWSLRKRPAKFLVLGGGPIGCELAQCFQRLGSQVTLVQKGPRILPREDKEASDFVEESFRKDGMTLLLDHGAKEFVVEGGKKFLICEHQGKDVKVEFDEIMVALGRKANVKGFGLEELDVKLTKQGTVEVDAFLKTNYPNIYAVGDVAGPYQFTHTASHMAWYAAVNSLFGALKKYKVDYRVVPWCTFTDPEVARVGLSEQDAKEKGIPYEVTLYHLDDLDRAIADQEAHGVVKVLTVPGKDKILGAMITGDHAGDYIVEFVAAMKHGFGMNKILGTIHIYPTLGEANKYAAGVWKKNHAPQGVLAWVEKFHRWRRGGGGGGASAGSVTPMPNSGSGTPPHSAAARAKH
jgi:dihydrolipoamide dehydrogenase